MREVGRYLLHDEIGSGGMASVHLGSLHGPSGFSRIVAIKRLLPRFATDPDVIARWIDEARITSRLKHPNVVPTLDVVAAEKELFLVMDYIHGASLADLMAAARERAERIPPSVAASVVVNVLHGLHSAHESKSLEGEPLGLVHRDVSPQNILVGVDGTARLSDFGIAKALGRIHVTRVGEVPGKLAYMAPEQTMGRTTRATDIFSVGVVLWEVLTGERLFHAQDKGALLARVLGEPIAPPSLVAGTVSEERTRQLEALDPIVARALDRDPAGRFPTAQAMATALEQCIGGASVAEVGAWVERTAAERLRARADRIAEIERGRAPALSVAPISASSLVSPSKRTMAETDATSARVATGKGTRRSRIVVGAAGLSALLVTGLYGWSAAKTGRSTKASDGVPSAVSPATMPPARSAERLQASARVLETAPVPTPPSPLASPAPRRKEPSVRRTPSSASLCDSPFFIDSFGRKVFREQCLR